jgi:putative transposase
MRDRSTRLSGFSYTGTFRYSLTFCTAERMAWFRDAECVRVMSTQLARAAERTGFDVLAYCAMPDHLHLLIEGRAASSDAKQFIKLSKQLTEFAHRQRWHARLWQASAWDRVLRTEDDSWAVIRYILANPVHAGLVKEPLDYPFSGSIKHTRVDLVDAFVRARRWT